MKAGCSRVSRRGRGPSGSGPMRTVSARTVIVPALPGPFVVPLTKPPRSTTSAPAVIPTVPPSPADSLLEVVSARIIELVRGSRGRMSSQSASMAIVPPLPEPEAPALIDPPSVRLTEPAPILMVPPLPEPEVPALIDPPPREIDRVGVDRDGAGLARARGGCADRPSLRDAH